jgi:plastocyanin
MLINNLLKLLWRPALGGLAVWTCAWPLSGQAAVANVNILDAAFSPANTTINTHDQVTWTWTGTLPHSTTSQTGVWNSTVVSPPHSFSWTFTNAGNYPYICLNHGFTGSVTVQSVNVPPSVAITSPTNGAVFAAPWTGTIQATVSDPDDAVSKVDFFAGAALLGAVTNPPASPSFTVTNLPAGNYTLTAVVTDSGGATNTSAGVGITVVTPVPIILSSPNRLSASAFQFTYSANPGLRYVVLRSGTLPTLSPISTNTAAGSAVNFLDNGATGAVNFYRVRLAPNP